MITPRLVKRSRPSSYKARDAAYRVGGHGGVYLAMYPRPYPKTRQQQRIGDAARSCGIKAGMSKAQLQTAMKECIPTKFGRPAISPL
jgi:hypothetical protein